MPRTFVTCAALMLAGVISSSSLALAEDAITHPASKTIGTSSSEMVASLPLPALLLLRGSLT